MSSLLWESLLCWCLSNHTQHSVVACTYRVFLDCSLYWIMFISQFVWTRTNSLQDSGSQLSKSVYFLPLSEALVNWFYHRSSSTWAFSTVAGSTVQYSDCSCLFISLGLHSHFWISASQYPSIIASECSSWLWSYLNCIQVSHDYTWMPQNSRYKL